MGLGVGSKGYQPSLSLLNPSLPAYNPLYRGDGCIVHNNTDSSGDFQQSQEQTHAIFSTAPKPFVHSYADRLIGMDSFVQNGLVITVFSLLLLAKPMVDLAETVIPEGRDSEV